MTDIVPVPNWGGVRQLETNEYATGGLNGNMNEQAKALAGQNMYSRLYAGLPFDPVFTAQVGGFPIGGSVTLENGDIVKSITPNNTNNPNTDMSGWVRPDHADQLFAENGKSLQELINADSQGGLSVFNFFTPVALAAYRANKAAFDAKVQLQAFFDFIAANNVGTARCSGEFASSEGIVYGSGTSATKIGVGNFKITALNAIDTLLEWNPGQDMNWVGVPELIGTGGTSYASRTCRIGFKLGTETKLASRSRFLGITARNFYETGITVPQLGSSSSLGYLRASDCGSGYGVAGYSLRSNFTFSSNTGTANSAGQRSILSVDTLPPDNIESDNTPLLVLISGQPYYVYSVDRVSKTLTVFPYIDNTILSGELIYDFGAGVSISGGDSSVLSGTMIDAVRCSRAYVGTALYAANFDRIISQFNGTAILLGQNPSAAHIGGVIGHLYCENNDRDLVRVTRSQLSVNILANTAFNLDKVKFTSAFRDGNNKFALYDNLSGFVYQNNGNIVTYQRPRATENPSPTFNVTSESDADFIYYGNTANLVIAAPNLNLYNMFGRFKRRVIVYGSGVGSKPTTVNFSLADAVNYTIDSTGVTTKTITGFDGFAEFDIIYRDDSKRFFISQVSNKDRSATAVYDPPSLAAGERSPTQTMTLTGAVLGDNINISFSRSLAGVTLTGYVSAADTISYYFENRTAATADLASGTVKAKIV